MESLHWFTFLTFWGKEFAFVCALQFFCKEFLFVPIDEFLNEVFFTKV